VPAGADGSASGIAFFIGWRLKCRGDTESRPPERPIVVNFLQFSPGRDQKSAYWLAPFFLVFSFLPSSASSQTVEVVLLNGKILRGTVLAIADQQVTLKIESEEQKFAFGELDSIKYSATNKLGESSTKDHLSLVDGSEIVCQGFSGSDDLWKAKVLGSGELTFPKGSVEAIRFGQAPLALQDQWRTVVAEERSTDQLVIVRPGDSTDVAPGLIGQISSEAVDFSFDGQSIQAPRSKLLGILWYRQRNKRVEPTIQIKLVDGSRWLATETSFQTENTNNIKWKTKSDVEAICRWEEVEAIDFSSANVVWLASQTPLEVEVFQRSFFKTEMPSRQLLLGPRFVALDGDDQAKSKDLCFKGPGRIVFRVPDGFSRFVARLHRSESAKYLSSIKLEVKDGDAIAWQADFAPNQEELKVNVPVTAGKKLTLSLSSDSELMVGTELYWDQPRLTR
jgi:hypothetical protein